MIHLDVTHSLRLIERERQRIDHQKFAVTKLRFDQNEISAALAIDMLRSMEARLGLLIKQHAELFANENSKEVSMRRPNLV